MVVIGTGEKVQTLADRRVAERGRLLVLLTDDQPTRFFSDDSKFRWWPPERTPPVGEQAHYMTRKYKLKSDRRWIRNGPDVVELKGDEEYEVNDGRSGVRVLSNGTMVWEVSGKVILADEVENAETEDLSVTTGLAQVLPVPSLKHCLTLMMFLLVVFVVGMCFHVYETSGLLPYWRFAYTCITGSMFAFTLSNMFAGACAVGIENHDVMTWVMHGTVGGVGLAAFLLIPIGSNTLNSFVACSLGVSCCVSILIPWHLYNVAQPNFKLKTGEVAPEIVSIFGVDFAWPRYWKYCVLSLNIGFGGWITFYAIGIAYVTANSAGFANLANTMLPIVATFTESQFVVIAQMTQERFAFRVQASGNPWYTLSGNLCLLHLFSESIKLTATVSGAALCEQNPAGFKWPEEGSCNPYGWVISQCVGLAITMMSRYGWTRYLTGRFFLTIGFKKAARMVRPTMTTKLHDEAKFNIGYARFVIPVALVISNCIVGKEALIFNAPATWCFLASLVSELIEDFVVFEEFFPYPPSPKPVPYMEYANYSPFQLYTFAAQPQNELESRRSRTVTRTTGKNGADVEMGMKRSTAHSLRVLFKTDGDYFPRALPLHGARTMTLVEHIPLVVIGCYFSMCCYPLLLGSGYFHGVCEVPLPGRDQIKEFILWPVPGGPPNCKYS